jgi:hypothetical protein
MRHQSREGEESKKRLKRVAGGPKTGLEKSDLAADTSPDDEIDPADFFDPEEFGIHRRGFHASRP